MANRWGFELANQKKGRNCLDQSGERRDLIKRNYKNVKVILLRDLTDLASRVLTHDSHMGSSLYHPTGIPSIIAY